MTKRTLLTLELASLFQPLRAPQFVSDYFERNLCVVHHGHSALAKIKEDLGGFDLESLLQKWRPQYIAAWFDNSREGHRSIRVEPSRALGLFSMGATLYFHLNGNSAADAWLAQLCSEIGIPVRGQVSIFASPAGAGIRPHFDANNNFTLQLSGSKRWSIGFNEDIILPTQNYVPTQPIHPDLRMSVPTRVEEISPRSLETLELSAGSVLYLPRGYWHGTTTLDAPSISLNFLCPPFTWIEAMCTRLRQTLLGSDAWRRSAHGLFGDRDGC